MKRKFKQIITAAMASAMLVGSVIPAYAAQFGSRYDGKGYWSDRESFTWTFFDGGSVTIGRGPVFSEVHPEITDPEYYLKDNIRYPGEADGQPTSFGGLKSDYSEALPYLQEFVHSFDWIHSDELTRVQKVHDRIANGRRGNEDQTSGKPMKGTSFPVLVHKIGNCGNYALEFEKLACYVGLECVSYNPFDTHIATLVKINGQWITVDPFMKEGFFDNSLTIPVDFEVEYNRYANDVKNSDWYKAQMEQMDWQNQAEAGEITWGEYYQRVYPEKSVQELEEYLGMTLEEYDWFCRNN